MADENKPPAPPASSSITPPAAAKADEAPLSPRAAAERAARIRAEVFKEEHKAREQLHADLRKHLAEVNSEQNTSAEPPPRVHEHAELRGYKQVPVLDRETMQWVNRPCWQMQALVARFHAHGLRHDARISHELFEKALHEALHGPV